MCLSRDHSRISCACESGCRTGYTRAQIWGPRLQDSEPSEEATPSTGPSILGSCSGSFRQLPYMCGDAGNLLVSLLWCVT